MTYEDTPLSRSIDLIDVECGAHYKVLDTDKKRNQVFMQCMKCERLMIVSEFKPQKQRKEPDVPPAPKELDTRSDQEISAEPVEELTEPEPSSNEIEQEPTES